MRNFSAEILIMRNIKIADSFVSTKSVRIRGRVQTTWTEFWAILTPPPPYVDTFTK